MTGYENTHAVGREMIAQMHEQVAGKSLLVAMSAESSSDTWKSKPSVQVLSGIIFGQWWETFFWKGSLKC